MSFLQKSQIESFLKQYRNQLLDAIGRTRKYNKPFIQVARIASKKPAASLLATSLLARRAWGKAICSSVAIHLCDGGDGLSHRSDLHFVTISDVDCTTADSERLSPRKLKEFARKLRRPLKGLNYIGMIEPALYVNLAEGSNYVKSNKCISWHLHAIVWGCAKRKLQRRIRQHNESGEYRPIADGLRAIDRKTVRPGTLPNVVAYMLKCPSRGYRLAVIDKKDADGNWMHNDYGEVLRGFSNNSGKLRPGETLTVFFAMLDLKLPELSVAGGDGEIVRSAALRCVT